MPRSVAVEQLSARSIMIHGGWSRKEDPRAASSRDALDSSLRSIKTLVAHQIGAGGKHQTLSGSSSASGAPKRMSSSMMLRVMYVPWVWRDSSCQAVASANHKAICNRPTGGRSGPAGGVEQPLHKILFFLLVARRWRQIWWSVT